MLRGNRARDVIEGFCTKQGFKAIETIDGSHIQIRPPAESPENYVNRKGFHYVILQAVCDHEMFLTDIYVGWPGSVHDASVFRRSPLCELLENNPLDMCPEGLCSIHPDSNVDDTIQRQWVPFTTKSTM